MSCMTGLVHSEPCRYPREKIAAADFRLYRDPDHVIEVKPRLLLSVLIARDPLIVVEKVDT